MNKCERCRRPHPNEYGLWDFCGVCSKNLCDSCMLHGCCKRIPAISGMEQDEKEDEQ